MLAQLPLVVCYHPVLGFRDVVQRGQVEVEKILTFEVLLRLRSLVFLITIKFVVNHVCLKRTSPVTKSLTLHGCSQHVLAEDERRVVARRVLLRSSREALKVSERSFLTDCVFFLFFKSFCLLLLHKILVVGLRHEETVVVQRCCWTQSCKPKPFGPFQAIIEIGKDFRLLY